MACGKNETKYWAISKDNLRDFNEELKEYTNEGYVPFGSLSVAICNDSASIEITEKYSILLCKTIKK